MSATRRRSEALAGAPSFPTTHSQSIFAPDCRTALMRSGRQWLGHASLNTTMRYVRADLDLKRQALSQVIPEARGAPTVGHLRIDGSEFTRCCVACGCLCGATATVHPATLAACSTYLRAIFLRCCQQSVIESGFRRQRNIWTGDCLTPSAPMNLRTVTALGVFG